MSERRTASKSVRQRNVLITGVTGTLGRQLAQHLYIAAEGKGADLVFGLTPAYAEQLGTKPQAEAQHFDAAPVRDQVVAQLVHDDQRAEHDQKRQYGLNQHHDGIISSVV